MTAPKPSRPRRPRVPELTEAQQLELLQRLRSLSWVAQDLRKSGKYWLKKHADLLDIQAEQLAKALRKFGIAVPPTEPESRAYGSTIKPMRKDFGPHYHRADREPQSQPPPAPPAIESELSPEELESVADKLMLPPAPPPSPATRYLPTWHERSTR